MYKYYSTMRPIMPGGYPRKDGVEITNFDDKKYCEEIERQAWGYLEYPEPLTEKEINDYELTSADLKTFWCVTSAVYDDGKVKSAITDTKKAVAKPENMCKEMKNKDIYIDWFESEEEAKEYVKDALNA